MSTLRTTYDESQHCIAVDQVKGKSGTMDCPYTGKGEELSPGNLLEAALSGCMLISMGAIAMRYDIDLTNKSAVVNLVGTLPTKIGCRAIDITVAMPAGLSAVVRDNHSAKQTRKDRPAKRRRLAAN